MLDDLDKCLLQIFSDTLGIAPTEVTDQSSPETLSSWTSLTHLVLMSAVEEKLNLTLSMEEMLDSSTFGALRGLVARHVIGGARESAHLQDS